MQLVSPGNGVSLSCPPGRSMAVLTGVTWFISRFAQQRPAGPLEIVRRERLMIGGNLFQGTIEGISWLLDLTIRNVSGQFEGRYSYIQLHEALCEPGGERCGACGCWMCISY